MQIGDIIVGRYKIVKKLGSGGTSTVYKAEDTKVKGAVWAIKEIKKTSSMYKAKLEAEGEFTEVKILSQIKSPFAPRIADLIESDETLIVIMDYIEGISLLDKLNQEGPQPELKVIDWIIAVCNLLESMHNLDIPIIYNDLKPSNIMLKPNNSISVIDFGAARYINAPIKKSRPGTIGFYSPEHKSGVTDQRSDIYTCGMTLYTLLTGEKGKGKDGYERNEVKSEKLERIISKATNYDPRLRYQSVKELREELEGYKLVELYSGDKDKAMSTDLLKTALLEWEASPVEIVTEKLEEETTKTKKTIPLEVINLIGSIIRTLATIILVVFATIGFITIFEPAMRELLFQTLESVKIFSELWN